MFRNYIETKIVTDGTGSLSSSEIEGATELDIHEMGITKQDGIQFFTALRRFL